MTTAKRRTALYRLRLLAGLLVLLSWNHLGASPTTSPVRAGGISTSAGPPISGEKRPAPPVPPAGGTPTPAACGPGTGAWTLQAPYPIPVANAAIVAQDGLLYSFGGFSGNIASPNAYKYTPGANVWTRLADLPEARAGASAVSDGTSLYIVNGWDANTNDRNTLYRYNPQTNTYTTLAPAPRATTLQAAVYLAGRIYRVAGSASGTHYTSGMDVYTIGSNQWAPEGTGAPYPQGAVEVAAVTDGAYIYAGGGDIYRQGATRFTYRYDPVTNTWSDAAVTNLPQDWIGQAAGVLNGYWIVSGEINGGRDVVVALDLRNPAGPWVALPGLPLGEDTPAGASTGTAFYVAGGDNGAGGGLATQEYTDLPCATSTPTPAPSGTPPTATPTATPPVCGPGTGSWRRQADYPIPIAGAAVMAQDGVVYSFGGYTTGQVVVANAYKYTPGSNTWTRIADLPAPRTQASAVSDGAYLYILDGSDGNAAQSTHYRYDPQSNTYTPRAPDLRPSQYQVAVQLAGKIYLLAHLRMDVYTIATDSWAPSYSAPPYPLDMTGLSAVAYGGYIYGAGGDEMDWLTIRKTYRYDPVSNAWDDASITDLPYTRIQAASAILDGRWILAENGVAAILDLRHPTDPWDNTPMLPAALGAAGGAATDHAFYSVGGAYRDQNNDLIPTQDNQAYAELPCATATPTPPPAPSLTPTPGCGPTPRPHDLLAVITDHPGTTEATFTNRSATCSYPIGLAVYKKFDNQIAHQELYDDQLAVIPPHGTLTLTVNNPPCAYQGDAFWGDLIVSFANGARYGARRLDDTDGNGSRFCHH